MVRKYKLDEENDPYLTKKVSRAKLHLVRPVCYNPTLQEVAALRKKGFHIQRGNFTRKEKRRLWKNWSRIREKFPEISDPFDAFGVTINPSLIVDGKIKPKPGKVAKERRCFQRKIHFMLRLAYKLDNRLICDIYNTAKKTIAYSNYKYPKRNGLKEKIVDEVIDGVINKELPCVMSAKLDVNPQIVHSIKAHPVKRTKFYWKPLDDMILEWSIERVCNTNNAKSIPLHKINFNRVSKEMQSCNYLLDTNQIYGRWYRLNSKMAGHDKENKFRELLTSLP